MYNVSSDIFDMLGTASVLLIFLIFAISIGIIILWVFSSLGIMNLAKKNNIPNPWLAFIPCGNSYLIGKLGFEIYPDEKNKNPNLTWVTFGLSVGAFLLNDDVGSLISLALLVFHSIAFYNIFKALTKNYVVFTVFTVLFNTLGGVFLYGIRNSFEEKVEDMKVIEKEDNLDKEIKPEEKIKSNFCSSCGNKIAKTAKFCNNCGQKIN